MNNQERQRLDVRFYTANLRIAKWYREEAGDIHPDDQRARSWARADAREFLRLAKSLRINRNLNERLPE
jgi:hypothetical protein